MENNTSIQTRHWWLFILRGIVLVGLGIWVLYTPLGSYVALSFLFSAAVLVAGVAELVHAVGNRHAPLWWLRFIAGVIDLALGVLLITHAVASMLVLPYVVSAFFLVRGIALSTLAPAIRGFIWMFAGGLLMVFFAIIILLNPAYGVFTIVSWAGVGLIIAGVINGLLAARLFAINNRQEKLNNYRH
jgi:uncharacterized membrane protein HdeD (DUF308 family)